MYRLVVLFLAYTGVRFGEMAALKVAPPRPAPPARGHRRVGHAGPGQGPGLGHAEVPPAPRGLRSRGSWSPTSPSTSPARSPTTWSSAASATASRCGSRPSAPRSASRPRPSASPTSTRTQLRHTAASLAIAVRRRREGRPADARTRLGHDDAGHLRPPVRGPARRGRRRDGRGPRREREKAAASAREVVDPRLDSASQPRCPSPNRSRRMHEDPPSQRFRRSEGSFGWYPRPDSNRRYRRERAAS